MECAGIHCTCGIDRHKRQADITLLFEYISKDSRLCGNDPFAGLYVNQAEFSSYRRYD